MYSLLHISHHLTCDIEDAGFIMSEILFGHPVFLRNEWRTAGDFECAGRILSEFEGDNEEQMRSRGRKRTLDLQSEVTKAMSHSDFGDD